MKKLLIATLVAAMVFAFGATAFAATTVSAPAFTDIAGHEAEFELTVMKALGVMTGDAGTTVVRPNDTITRAEVSKVLVTMLGRQAIAAGMAGVRPSFTDEVPTWAWGFVNCAQVMGLVGGYEDGTFRASNPVTYAEVITMLVRGVSGHKEQVAPGFWPYNFLFHAIDYGFTGDVDMGFANLPAPRGDVARLAFATMQVDKLSLAAGTFGEPIADSAILAGNGAGQLGFVYTGVVTDYSLAASQITFNPTKTLADSVYLVGASNFESLMNLSIIAVAGKNDKVLAIGKTQSVDTFFGIFTGFEVSTTGVYSMVFSDGTKIPLAGTPYDLPTRVNGWLNHAAGNLDWDFCEGSMMELLVTKDAAGKAKFAVGTYFVANQWFITDVTASDKDNDTYVQTNGCSYYIPASARVTINGVVSNRDALAKWDVAWHAWSWTTCCDAYEVRAVRQTVQGTIDSVHTTYPGPKEYVTIKKDDGTKVTFLNKTGSSYVGSSGYYKFALDKAGSLFVEITAETMTPYVLVKGYTDFGAYQTVTVDVRGAEVTYQLQGTPFDHTVVDKFGELEIDSITGKVTDFTAATLTGEFEVMAVDTTNKTMTLRSGVDYFFINDKDAVVYSKAAKYIGLEGLKVGDWLKADAGKVIFQVRDAPVV